MNTYKIVVEERLVREISVDAQSVDEALQSVADKWHSSLIVLDADDFAGVQMRCVEPESTEWEELD